MKPKTWRKQAVYAVLIAGLVIGFGGCGTKPEEKTEEPAVSNEEESKEDEEAVSVEDLSDVIVKDTYRNETAIHDASLFKDGNLY